MGRMGQTSTVQTAALCLLMLPSWLSFDHASAYIQAGVIYHLLGSLLQCKFLRFYGSLTYIIRFLVYLFS